MIDSLKTIIIIIVILIGAVSIAYFYFSTDIFIDVLKRPLRLISYGMMLIDIGVLLITLISYEASRGNLTLAFFGVPLSTYFYVFYVAGSVMIVLGARHFTSRKTQKLESF